MSPQHEGILIISIVFHMICIIPNTSTNHIHHSALRGENFYSTNRGECFEQTKIKVFFTSRVLRVSPDAWVDVGLQRGMNDD